MTFFYESEMVMPARKWLASLGLETRREFATPWGICDLVGCSLKRDHVRKRLALGQTRSIRSQLGCMILFRVPDVESGRSISLRRLRSLLTEVSDDLAVYAEIDNLVRRRFVQETPRGCLQKLNGWMPLHQRLVALELKLSRIDDALHQAIRHLAFADESYVGLPADRALRLANSMRAADFVRAGVGIVAVRRDRCAVLTRSAPRRKHQNAALQMVYAERFLQPHLQAIQH